MTMKKVTYAIYFLPTLSKPFSCRQAAPKTQQQISLADSIHKHIKNSQKCLLKITVSRVCGIIVPGSILILKKIICQTRHDNQQKKLTLPMSLCPSNTDDLESPLLYDVHYLCLKSLYQNKHKSLRIQNLVPNIIFFLLNRDTPSFGRGDIS